MNQYFFNVIREQYADFDGRATRRQYWMFYLFYMLIFIAFYLLMLIFAQKTLGSIIEIIMYLFAFATIIPNLAITIRRLHDIGKSGWWYFISCVPLIGSIWFFILLVTESYPLDNKYGPYIIYD